MAKVYATPGVYIEEKSAFPNSAVPVATAVPAFVGYTEKAVLNKRDITHVPTRISSLGEYLLYFGEGPSTTYSLAEDKDPNKVYALKPKDKRFFLFHCMKMFFANGGSDCYIVSIGNYESEISPDDFENESTDPVTQEKKLMGIRALLNEPEPTMVVVPDAVLLGQDDCYSLQQKMLIHCGTDMRSRIAILDVYDGFLKRTPDDSDVIDKFRIGVGANNLQWGTAYYPWVHTTITSAESIDFTNIDSESNEHLVAILTKEVDEAVKAGILDLNRANLIRQKIAETKRYNPVVMSLADAKALKEAAEQGLVSAKRKETAAKEGFDGAKPPADKADLKQKWESAKADAAMAQVNVDIADATLLKADAAAKAAFLRDARKDVPDFKKPVAAAKNAFDDAEEKQEKAAGLLKAAKTKEDIAKAGDDVAQAEAALAMAKAEHLLAKSVAAAAAYKEKQTDAEQKIKAANADPSKKGAADAAIKAADALKEPADTARSAAETAAAELAEAVAKKARVPADDIKTHHQTMIAVSPMYKSIMSSLREHINLLPPSAGMAGVYSMVDNNIGVFQSPANVSIGSVVRPAVNLTNDEQEDLNMPLTGKAVNAIRTFPGKGVLVWGARTLDGNSQDWKYVSVRRTVIFIEQSIKYAAEPYVFSPNTAATWTNVKAMLSNFLTNVWQQGALAGASAEDAFSVYIGLGETMTPVDILDGIMRITVKLAVTRPAEFIIITFEQQMQKS